MSIKASFAIVAKTPIDKVDANFGFIVVGDVLFLS
jgi:hypothetical protein